RRTALDDFGKLLLSGRQLEFWSHVERELRADFSFDRKLPLLLHGTRLHDDRHGHGQSVESPDRAAPPDLPSRRQRRRVARIRFKVSKLTLRPDKTTTAGPPRPPTLPVRQAATVAAAEGSIRY